MLRQETILEAARKILKIGQAIISLILLGVMVGLLFVQVGLDRLINYSKTPKARR